MSGEDLYQLAAKYYTGACTDIAYCAKVENYDLRLLLQKDQLALCEFKQLIEAKIINSRKGYESAAMAGHSFYPKPVYVSKQSDDCVLMKHLAKTYNYQGIKLDFSSTGGCHEDYGCFPKECSLFARWDKLE